MSVGAGGHLERLGIAAGHLVDDVDLLQRHLDRGALLARWTPARTALQNCAPTFPFRSRSMSVLNCLLRLGEVDVAERRAVLARGVPTAGRCGRR